MSEKFPECTLSIVLVFLIFLGICSLVWWVQNRPCAPDEHRVICYGIDAKGNRVCDKEQNEYGIVEERYHSFCEKNCIIPPGVTNLSEFETEHNCVNATWVLK